MSYSDRKLEVTEEKLSKINPRPTVLVELGGYVGKSAVAWGPLLRRINSAVSETSLSSATTDNVKVFSLELEPDFCKVIQAFIDLGGLTDTVTVMQGESATSLKKLKTSGLDHIDVLFLDHWKDCYLPDLQLCEDLRLLRKGSVVVADNTDVPGAPDYLAYVEGGGRGGWKYRCESVNVNEGQGRPVSISSNIWTLEASCEKLTTCRISCISHTLRQLHENRQQVAHLPTLITIFGYP